jgi:hypothetical protein
MVPCIANAFLSTTNEMQRYTMFFIVVNALHVSSGFSAHHQEVKNCTCSTGYLCIVTASLVESELNQASGNNIQVSQVPDAECTVFELLMMNGKTARNM